MKTGEFYPSCLRIPTAPFWKPLSHSLATPLQHLVLLHCKSQDFPRGWESPSPLLGNLPPFTAGDSPWPDVCHGPPRAPCSRASVLPRAGLADPHRHTARPAASCPWAGCRCRRWAQSISAASGCEQAAGHPIRRDWICCVALQCCISGHLRTPVPRSGQGQAARCSRGEGRATQSSVITAAVAH